MEERKTVRERMVLEKMAPGKTVSGKMDQGKMVLERTDLGKTEAVYTYFHIHLCFFPWIPLNFPHRQLQRWDDTFLPYMVQNIAHTSYYKDSFHRPMWAHNHIRMPLKNLL